jgi:hypothetical protein
MKRTSITGLEKNFDQVMQDVTINKEPYVIEVVNTIQSSRWKGDYIPVAVVMPYDIYEDQQRRLAQLENEIDYRDRSQWRPDDGI